MSDGHQDIGLKTWWKEAVVYQIYPRSFMDSNGDGIGDLQGIIEKLDYLKWLGVDVIWLGPVYQSPNHDNGYDISDYCSIQQDFGDMSDFDALLEGLHVRGMKMLMDLVVNHTSDEHAWFQQARMGKNNRFRDYYIWRSNESGRRPNNWAAFFGGSAWELDEASDEYYLHLFSARQPDLNWDNPILRSEIHGMMKWWLDKGVDGFRMDVINAVSKVPGLPDARGEGDLEWGGDLFLNGPHVHEYLREMTAAVLSRYDVMTVGETLAVTPEAALKYVGADRGELNMVFQFELMEIDAGPGGKWDVRPWTLTEFKRIASRWQTELHDRGWNSLYLNNHDQPRLVSRFGDDGVYRVQSAKMLATLLHTWQGTPFIYQGEEIGMTNVRFPDIDHYRDIETLNWYVEQRTKGVLSTSAIMGAIHRKSRDNARTPMQWSDDPQAGFSTSQPWLEVNPNYREINVKRQVDDPDSVLQYYRRLIQLRRTTPILIYGDYTLLSPGEEDVYAFTRQMGRSQLLTVLNFTGETQMFPWPLDAAPGHFSLILCNYWGEGPTGDGTIALRPYEARVYLS